MRVVGGLLVVLWLAVVGMCCYATVEMLRVLAR